MSAGYCYSKLDVDLYVFTVKYHKITAVLNKLHQSEIDVLIHLPLADLTINGWRKANSTCQPINNLIIMDKMFRKLYIY